MNTIDVDVGGTFTDLVLTLDGTTSYRKVPTTPYDLSVGFMQVVEEAAEEQGLSLEALVEQVQTVRYSTTVAMNRLLERSGPRVALITTQGHEDATLIGKGAQWIDGTRLDERRALPLQNKPAPIVPRELIVGVKERIDARGQIVRPLDEDHVREQVRRLVDRGARAFVVSLLWSFVNPQHEKAVKRIIREGYRDYHVGYLPVILSSEVVSRLGEYGRSNTAILDAYLQRSMQIELSGTWDKLRERGYRGPFFMIHNTGGCADLFKTTASRTYNGGPIAGLIGARDIARQLGAHNVVTADVGGTSFDIGLVVGDSVRNYEFNPIIDQWMVSTTMLQSLSIGAGGGSIAWINDALGGRARGRPRRGRPLPRPGALRARRHRADRHGREPRSRPSQPRRVLRRPDGAGPRGGGGGDPRAHRRAAERLGRRGGGAHPPHHRRQDGLGHPQGGDAARLPADGLHAVRVRWRRPDPRRRLHGRDPACGDVPVLAGVLRLRLLDH